jgi:hypothetical protein
MVRVEKVGRFIGVAPEKIRAAYPAPVDARVEGACLIAKADQVEVGRLLAQRDQRLVGRWIAIPAVDRRLVGKADDDEIAVPVLAGSRCGQLAAKEQFGTPRGRAWPAPGRGIAPIFPHP